VSFEQYKKAILEGVVICGLVGAGIYFVIKGDSTNAAWALGLAGGYVFKNGVKYVGTTGS